MRFLLHGLPILWYPVCGRVCVSVKKKLRSEFNSRQYMLARDFEVYYYSDLRFSSVGRHSHSYTEVYLFCEGEVDMEIGDRRFSLRPGDVLVLPPGTAHRAVVRSGERPYRRFVFWLSEDFCRALRAESPDFLYLFDRVQKKKEYVHPMDALEFNSLRSQLFTLLEELHTNRFGRDAQIGLYVRMLLLTLSRTVWQRENPRARKETRSSYLKLPAHHGLCCRASGRRPQSGHPEPRAVSEQISYRPSVPGEHRPLSAPVHYEKASLGLRGCHAERKAHQRDLFSVRLSELFELLSCLPKGIRLLARHLAGRAPFRRRCADRRASF